MIIKTLLATGHAALVWLVSRSNNKRFGRFCTMRCHTLFLGGVVRFDINSGLSASTYTVLQ